MTAPVYTVDDDSDEETPKENNAEISLRTKGGRAARKRNHTE